MIKHEYGPLLRQYREKAGKTQLQAAKALGYTCGQYISNMESGKCMVPLRKIKTLAQMYKTKPEVIVNALTSHYKKRVMKISGLATK